MNKIDQNPDYRKIYSIACKYFHKSGNFSHGAYDETYFTMRVFSSAKQIMSELRKKSQKQDCTFSEQLVLVSCLLHDIGKSRLDRKKLFHPKGNYKNIHLEWSKHPKLGISPARRILQNLGHSKEFIDAICYLVEFHDCRAEKHSLIPKSSPNLQFLRRGIPLELLVLQDADILADCGFAGFIRPFLFGGRFRRPVIGSIRYAKKEMNRVDMPGMLNLSVSRRIAKKKMMFHNDLVGIVNGELENELL